MGLVNPSTNPWPLVIMSLLLLMGALAVFAVFNARDSGEGSGVPEYGWPATVYRGFDDGDEGGSLSFPGILIDVATLLALVLLAMAPGVWAVERRARKLLEDIS